MTGEIDDEDGEPLETGLALILPSAIVEDGVTGDRRWLFNELVSLISVRSSSSLSLFSSELLSVSAASIDFLCMPRREKRTLEAVEYDVSNREKFLGIDTLSIVVEDSTIH